MFFFFMDVYDVHGIHDGLHVSDEVGGGAILGIVRDRARVGNGGDVRDGDALRLNATP